MRILLAIHPAIGLMSSEFHSFLLTHLKQDPNTYLLLFPSYPAEKERLEQLKEKFEKFRENFIYIEPRPFHERVWFSSYKKQFKQTIELLQKKCEKNESIQVISFGGAARTCYKNINQPALKIIIKRLGKGRKLSAYPFPQFIYGTAEPRKNQPQPPEPKTPLQKTWFQKFFRRRK